MSKRTARGQDPTTQVRLQPRGRLIRATSDTPFNDRQFVQWFRNGMPEMWRILEYGGLSKAHVPKHLVPEIKALFLAQGYEFVSQEQSETLANRYWLIFRKPLEADDESAARIRNTPDEALEYETA